MHHKLKIEKLQFDLYKKLYKLSNFPNDKKKRLTWSNVFLTGRVSKCDW